MNHQINYAVMAQKLDDNLQYQKDCNIQFRDDLKNLNVKLDEYNCSIASIKEELQNELRNVNNKISTVDTKVDKKLLGVKIISIGASAISGFIGGFMGALLELRKFLGGGSP